MKLLKILPVLILLSCLTNKNVDRKITIKQIGWQFPLTNETNFKDSAFNSKGELLDEIPADGPSLRLFTIAELDSREQGIATSKTNNATVRQGAVKVPEGPGPEFGPFRDGSTLNSNMNIRDQNHLQFSKNVTYQLTGVALSANQTTITQNVLQNSNTFQEVTNGNLQLNSVNVYVMDQNQLNNVQASITNSLRAIFSNNNLPVNFIINNTVVQNNLPQNSNGVGIAVNLVTRLNPPQ